jgi:hypothetical protein
VAGAVGRIVKYEKAADDFDEHVSKLLPHIAALRSWLGTAGCALLKATGIAPWFSFENRDKRARIVLVPTIADD